MHFTSTAVGLSLLAAHATAFAVPPKDNHHYGAFKTGSVKPGHFWPLNRPITVTVHPTGTAAPSRLPKATGTHRHSSTPKTPTIPTSTPSSSSSPTPSPSSSPISSPSSSTTPTPTPTPGPDLTADQQKALDLHNIYRAAVGSANLTWDADLAKNAQAWANHLAANDGGLQHNPDRGDRGENLASQFGGNTNYYANAAQLWLNEKSLYDGKPITETGNPNYHQYGHYTQAIWSSTKRVGLALATSKSGTTYVVGEYQPAGNYLGQLPYSQ